LTSVHRAQAIVFSIPELIWHQPSLGETPGRALVHRFLFRLARIACTLRFVCFLCCFVGVLVLVVLLRMLLRGQRLSLQSTTKQQRRGGAAVCPVCQQVMQSCCLVQFVYASSGWRGIRPMSPGAGISSVRAAPGQSVWLFSHSELTASRCRCHALHNGVLVAHVEALLSSQRVRLTWA